jgi:cyclophilin family peptidyl-prolyl cis-trans isomerase/HEAT repeat protein
MTVLRSKRFPLATLSVVLLASSCVPDAGRPDVAARTYLRILAAEDARPTGGPDLAVIEEAAKLDHEFLRQTAVRALGRLENPDLIEVIAEKLDDPATSVRVAAADAIAQAVHRTDGAPALAPLMARVAVESNPGVVGVLARSLGRLSLPLEDRIRVQETLVDLSVAGNADAELPALLGVTLGLESLLRETHGEGLSERAAARLSNLIFYDLVERKSGSDAAQVRMLALTALAEAGQLTVQLVEPGLRDPDPRVRSAAARELGVVVPAARSELIRRALIDPSMRVRIEAVREIARGPRDEMACTRLVAAATRDESDAVRVLALDALSQPCPDRNEQVKTLLGAASSLGPETRDGWQPAAHALVSLARIAPELAREQLTTYTAHAVPFVRAYGARATALLGDLDLLTKLARLDPDPNVRTVAIQELFERRGHEIDDLLILQWVDNDPQLILTSARLLGGSPLGFPVAAAALNALERISKARRETWRDPRMALLTLVGELGNASLDDRLRPFLSDYDPVVAARVAETLERWTGEPVTASPRPLPRIALPDAEDLRAMEQTTVALHMRKGGTIEIQLLPYLATTNAFRFMRLAREGYFDGLTFHRWVPNFVIQGGSPGANEYSGDGPYTRDEVGLLPHWRGTVGVSTRGHDTADGQLFINLVDNVRLDHDYTVFGVVVSGRDVADRVLEGDVIERAEVRTER